MPGQRRRQWPRIDPILRVGMDSINLLNATFDSKDNSCIPFQQQDVDSMLF